MSKTLCKKCAAWEANPEDTFCGYCGETLISAIVTITPNIIYRDYYPPTHITISATKEHGNLEYTSFIWRRNHDGKEVQIPDLKFNDNTPTGYVIYDEFPLDLLIDDNPKDVAEWQLLHRINTDNESIISSLTVAPTLPDIKILTKEILIEEDSSDICLTLQQETEGNFTISHISIISSNDAEPEVNLPLANLESPITLSNNKKIDFPLKLSNSLINLLEREHQGKSFILRVKNEQLPPGKQYYPIGSFTIRTPSPAEPVIRINSEQFDNARHIQALENEYLCIDLNIKNRGGDICTISGFKLEMSGGGHSGEIRPYDHLVEEPIQLNINEDTDYNLYIPLDRIQKDFASEQSYALRISLLTSNENEVIQRTVDTNVWIRERGIFEGTVVIDFGTTASAAAILIDGNPFVIPLSKKNKKIKYIPTAIAYYIDSETGEQTYCIGNEAQRRYKESEASEVFYFDNIKWRLTETESIPLCGGEKLYWQIAADYLKEIRERIKNNNKVMGEIKRVYITQPANFSPRLSMLLERAYKEAGMTANIHTTVNHTVSRISESWPSVTLGFPRLAMLDWQKSFFTGELKEKVQPTVGKYLWLNFDMGGGSTDLSLMSLDVPTKNKLILKEIASDGDNNLAGNYISELIFKHITLIHPDYKTHLKANDNYPLVFPWESKMHRNTADHEISLYNGHSILDNILFPLQKSEGGSGIIEKNFQFISFRDELIHYWIDNSQSVADNKEIKDALERFSNSVTLNIEGDLSNNIEGDLELTLKTNDWEEITLRGENIKFDVLSFLQDFITNVSQKLYKKTERLLQHIDNIDEYSCLFMVSGRGALFQPVLGMTEAFSHNLFSANKKPDTSIPLGIGTYIRIADDNSKTIVCSGGCHIANLLAVGRDQARRITFQSLPPPMFGFISDDDEDGNEKFTALHEQFIHPELGWLAPKEYPLNPGTNQLNISFCESHTELGTFTADNRVLVTISGRITVKEEQADAAHIQVRLHKTGELEVAIALPPEGNPSNYESWTKIPLGKELIMPSAL